MVRPTANPDVKSRIADRLSRSGCHVNGELQTLSVVPGDLRAPGLGLPADAANRLRREVEIIIHSASETSFIRNKDCHDSNISGMRHLLEFAKTCARRPLIVYLSTAANGGAYTHRCLDEDEGCRPDATHHNGYTHSKALAERMLWDSGLPALVLRPSIVFSAGLPDPKFARAILWFVPLLNDLDAAPMDPDSRLDTIPVSSVVESTLRLLQLPNRKHDCYHLSSGPAHAMTCGKLIEFTDRYYERKHPLQLFKPEQWTREMHRRFIRTPQQRVSFSMLRHYLPFLNMDVVYDTTRLADELGEAAVRIPPFISYMGELLDLIPHEAALAEAYNP
jgi:nucleoside-diphosphate-sugar epimerase